MNRFDLANTILVLKRDFLLTKYFRMLVNSLLVPWNSTRICLRLRRYDSQLLEKNTTNATNGKVILLLKCSTILL